MVVKYSTKGLIRIKHQSQCCNECYTLRCFFALLATVSQCFYFNQHAKLRLLDLIEKKISCMGYQLRLTSNIQTYPQVAVPSVDQKCRRFEINFFITMRWERNCGSNWSSIRVDGEDRRFANRKSGPWTVIEKLPNGVNFFIQNDLSRKRWLFFTIDYPIAMSLNLKMHPYISRLELTTQRQSYLPIHRLTLIVIMRIFLSLFVIVDIDTSTSQLLGKLYNELMTKAMKWEGGM